MARTTKIRTQSGDEVIARLEHGREYRRRIELSHDGRTVVYGVIRERGKPVADLVASYDDGSLQGIGGDSTQPDWAEPTLDQLDIREVRA